MLFDITFSFSILSVQDLNQAAKHEAIKRERIDPEAIVVRTVVVVCAKTQADLKLDS